MLNLGVIFEKMQCSIKHIKNITQKGGFETKQNIYSIYLLNELFTKYYSYNFEQLQLAILLFIHSNW